MRVNGEAFFLMNGWMNFLSLLMAGCLARARFHLGRALLASAVGALYAMLAWGWLPALRRLPVLGAAALIMAAIAFRKRAAALCPLLLAAGLMLSGLGDFLLARGLPAAGVMLFCGGVTLALIRRLNGLFTPCGHDLTVKVVWRGCGARLPAWLDSGNLLQDPVTGLPVIVVPAEGLRVLLPPGVKPGDWTTLPPGFRLLRVRTAAGEQMLMCFHPDQVMIYTGGRAQEMDAVVALSDAGLPRALVPGTMLQTEEGFIHAGL
ncbi:MAG: sigma-E processing peptidase SpoIIGA [Clostridia bacterium]|nr:sigma-E processing peptidase SpoIIGA [Clostridia bacterium]